MVFMVSSPFPIVMVIYLLLMVKSPCFVVLMVLMPC
jgi:hypothetical protein